MVISINVEKNTVSYLLLSHDAKKKKATNNNKNSKQIRNKKEFLLSNRCLIKISLPANDKTKTVGETRIYFLLMWIWAILASMTAPWSSEDQLSRR